MFTKTVFAAVLVAAAGAGVAEARQIPVSRAGVDFLDASAVDTFYRDLARAANKACNARGRTLDDAQLRRECRAEALDRAVADANVETLRVLHSELAPALRFNPERPALDGRLLAAVTAAAESMRAEYAPTQVAALR